MTEESFADRVLISFHDLTRRRRVPRITFAELAREVAEATGQQVAVSTVTRWFAGAIPEPHLLVGLATVLGDGLYEGIDPGWLLLGPHTRAPSPNFIRMAPVSAFRSPAEGIKAVEEMRRQEAAKKKRTKRA